ncbi:MAG: hypothetical protein ABID64_03700 [Nitrospirota bacterium]
MPPKKKNTSKKEIVLKKKVIYAEIDDEVTDIYDKFSSVRAKHVYIVLPKRAIFFQSIVNLKILKRKADDTGKIIYFITNDKNGIHLAGQVGIEVYNKATGEGPALFSTDVDDEKLRITPLRATVNSVDEQAPTRLAERKLSISEILRRKKTNKTVDISAIQNPPKTKKKKSKFVIVAPNRHALIGLTVLSIFILLVIVYIALPGVTIYLTPSASVLEKSVNITLADYQNNQAELSTRPPHMVASYPINTTVTKSVTHYSTGKKFSDNGANASGKITIINTTGNAWPLIDNTRFQTDEGIVFRITQGVTVPAATTADFGRLEVIVIADQLDSYDAIAGERGNIEPSKFFLPGLREGSQSELYAESYEPMTGGVTDYVSYISAEDIEAAKSRMNDELLKAAVEELKVAVSEKSQLVAGSTTYSLLEGEGAIQLGDVTVNVAGNLEGQTVSEFSVSGEVYVSGVYYDHDAMLEILKSELLLKKSPQKELLRINEDSTSYRIFEWDEYSGKIKLTANIKGIEQFSIDPNKENGEKLLAKIKEHIAGKDIEEAKLYIQNLPEINKVEIDSWPVWSPTIPNIPENIEFEIRDAITVE